MAGQRRTAGTLAAIVLLLLANSCGSSSDITTRPSPVKCGVQARTESTGFPAAGGSGTLTITTNRECTWSAQSDASWLVLPSAASGQGSGSLAFRVAQNAQPSVRSAHIRVQDQQLEISQQAAACDLRVSSNHESVGAPGGTRTVKVAASSAQCSWTAASRVSWITIASGSAGQGDGAVELRVSATLGPPRSGTVTIAGETVTVDQGTGCSVDVDQRSFAIAGGGGRGTIHVQAKSGCAWTAASDAGWIDITSGGSGDGDGEVRFSVAAFDGPARTGTIQIGDQTITVAQGSGCAVTVDPSAVRVGAAAASATLRVDSASGCAWSASSDAAWVTIAAGSSGQGSGHLDLAIAANAGPERSATLMIGGRVVTITQAAGCTFGASPRSVDLAGGGGSAAVSVATAGGCSWTAAGQSDWISVSPSSGAGAATVQVTAAANNTPPRSGTATVAGRTVTVNQASLCTFVLAPRSLEYNADGGAGAVLVIVTGACSWTAASTVPWITITAGESGAGSGHVEFRIAANADAARTGSLTIAGQTVPVTQSGP